jgi:RimJ/RimL family protein N-acetyltransferase
LKARILVAGRVTLEPQMAGHAEEMFPVLSDPSLYPFLDQPPPASLEWLRERFRKLEARQSPDGGERWLNWIIRTEARQPVGFVQATVHGASADIAFVLGSAHWGRGLAHEAAQAMVSELIDYHDVTRFFATAARDNLRSIRLLKRLGFSRVEPALYAERQVAPGDVLMAMQVERKT